MEVNLKSVNVICYVSRPKRNHMIISVGPEKALDKIQYPLLIKILSKLEVEENIFNPIISMYGKSTANIILNDEKLNICPLRSETRQVSFFTPTFSQHYPSYCNRVRKVNKDLQIGNKEVKLPVFSENMIYIHRSFYIDI